VIRADLLLALDDELDVDRQLALGPEQRLDGGEVGDDARLVVDHAAAVEAAVLAHGRLEGRRLPVRLAAGGCTSWWA
jgi:hypothetical protein